MMNKPERKKLYLRAIRKWGYKFQLIMLMEECAELIHATSKLIRHGDKQSIENIAEEMADVEIMIEQIKMNTDWELLEEKVQEFKEQKLHKLRGMVNENKESELQKISR